MNKYCLAYTLSVIVALPITYGWSCLLHKRVRSVKTDEDKVAERILWLPLLTGVFERVLITTLVGWEVQGAGAFIGSWVLVKAVGGWQSWSKGTTYGRSIFSVGLLGSALSIFFGIVGGLIIAAK
jgi:hypothetical protein